MEDIGDIEKNLESCSDDDERVSVLLEMSEKWRNKNIEKSLFFSEKALSIAENNGDKRQIAKSVFYVGTGKALCGKLRESVILFEKALEIAEEIGDEGLKASLCSSVGLNRYYLGDYALALEKLEKAVTFSKETGNEIVLAQALSNLALVYDKIGKPEKSLELLLESLRIEESLEKNFVKIADTLGNIGTIYKSISDIEKAFEFYEKSLILYIRARDKKGMAGAMSNMASVFEEKGSVEKAQKYYSKALKLAREVDHREFESKILNNLGFLFFNKKIFAKSLEYYYEALKIAEETSNKSSEANYLNNIANVFKETGEIEKARSHAEKALSIAEEISDVRLESEILKNLSALLNDKGDHRRAYELLKKAVQISDSLYEDSIAKKITDLEIRFEVEKREREAEIAGTRAEIFRLKNTELNELLVNLEIEKSKTESLLEVVLPREVIEDLKKGKMAGYRKFEGVTVFYSDIAEFTRISSELTPDVLIDELNDMFSAFDLILEKHGIERIMTIGDACLAASGLFGENQFDPGRIVAAAVECQKYTAERNNQARIPWLVRIGIHTGGVLGGVMGGKRYIFDIMGEGVDVAKFIETSVEPSEIGLSEKTVSYLKDIYTFSEPETLDIPGYEKVKVMTIVNEYT
ncbi:tetratricopeptide repeat protein [candidate division WOR-3 bacterium]|nr:tetratricopeptide repeat protein [candidate division WOR-3 bacterium]